MKCRLINLALLSVLVCIKITVNAQVAPGTYTVIPQPSVLSPQPGHFILNRNTVIIPSSGVLFGAAVRELKTMKDKTLSLIHISEPTRQAALSRMPSSA